MGLFVAIRHCMDQNYRFKFNATNHYSEKIMLHDDILYIFYCKYIKTYFFISNMHC